jgi:sulfotransferase
MASNGGGGLVRAFHAIAGLPRSGSTLLCNLLSQNPAFYAARSTSPLPVLTATISEWFSASIEFKSDLHADPVEAQQRQRLVMQSVLTSWYIRRGAEVVFDKSRGGRITTSCSGRSGYNRAASLGGYILADCHD